MLQVVKTSSKSLRDSRKSLVFAALLRHTQKIDETPLEEGADRIVKTQKAAKVLSWYRQTITEVGGSVPQLGSEFFSEDEAKALDSIESSLWARGDQKNPPKSGVEVATRMGIRSIVQLLVRGMNGEVFGGGDDAGACFLETVHYGLPKLHTPKGAVATADVDSLIRQLLGL